MKQEDLGRMGKLLSRRAALAQLAAAGAAGALVGPSSAAELQSRQAGSGGFPLKVAGQPVELQVVAVTPYTLRLSLVPISADGTVRHVEESLALAQREWPPPLARVRSVQNSLSVRKDETRLVLSHLENGVQIDVFPRSSLRVRQLRISVSDGTVRFSLNDGPLFGLGEGGPQLDRRGHAYPMDNGQAGPDLDVTGARMPIPWLIGSAGWALFFHQPSGSFDLTGAEGCFAPIDGQRLVPLDFFLTAAADPRLIMKEYAKLTGFPHMPPVWALGYLQSHRTLVSREEVLDEARTFRGKKLPCDALIYLGTGFCPSGWNTGHGSFTFNSRVFPDPEEIIRELHAEHFRIVLHVVNPPKHLHGRVTGRDADLETADDARRYWDEHLKVFRLGVDGWWPDEGDGLPAESRLVRNRMYWEGPQLERPTLRPFALHRNGYAGMQRYAWLWSGDIDSVWQTLRAQVQVGINTGLSGMPYWGTDTGGFVTTPELTGELFVRWFQFSAFCPLFRSHGRTWKLRLPWGWDTGEYGPTELEGYSGRSGLPDRSELHNPQVEPICRKYLDLRYRLLPYLYTAVREAHDTGLPVMRALWLHYPDDPHALERGDEYLWGRDILVCPVTEKAASSRTLYLPPGLWYDFWTEERLEGGREITRAVDLATLPLYVRAGAIIPMGPAKQYTTEPADGALTLNVYSGADSELELYEDDGVSFNFRRGEFMRLRASWRDRSRELNLSLAEGSKMLAPSPRKIDVRVVPGGSRNQVLFNGKLKALRF